MRSAIIALVLLALTGCSDSVATEAQDPFGYAERQPLEDQMRKGRDLAGTEAPISGLIAGETYQEWDRRRDTGPADYMRGFGCTDDCSGHLAGYQWARANRITDDWRCDGDSWSFIEGCAAFAAEDDEPEEAETSNLDLGL